MGAAAILGGEKRDDLPSVGVREITVAVHPRFYGSWDPMGAGSPLLPALPGVGSTTGIAAGGSLIFLALGPADSIFLVGVAPSSRV